MSFVSLSRSRVLQSFLSVVLLAICINPAFSNDFFKPGNVQYNQGEQGGSPYTAGGVNVMSGNFLKSEQDMLIPGNGIPLQVNRTYSSVQSTIYENWIIQSGIWKIEKHSTSSNEMSGQDGALLSAIPYADFKMELDMKVIDGDRGRVFFQYQADTTTKAESYYAFVMDKDGNVALGKKTKTGTYGNLIGPIKPAETNFNPYIWNHITIHFYRGCISVKVGSNKAISYNDNHPLTFGQICLNTCKDQGTGQFLHTHYDNINIGNGASVMTDNFDTNFCPIVRSGDWWTDDESGCLMGEKGSFAFDMPQDPDWNSNGTPRTQDLAYRAAKASVNLTFSVKTIWFPEPNIKFLYQDDNNCCVLRMTPGWISLDYIKNGNSTEIVHAPVTDFRTLDLNKITVISTLNTPPVLGPYLYSRDYTIIVNDQVVAQGVIPSALTQGDGILWDGWKVFETTGTALFDDVIINELPYSQETQKQKHFDPGFILWYPQGTWFSGMFSFPGNGYYCIQPRDFCNIWGNDQDNTYTDKIFKNFNLTVTPIIETPAYGSSVYDYPYYYRSMAHHAVCVMVRYTDESNYYQVMMNKLINDEVICTITKKKDGVDSPLVVTQHNKIYSSFNLQGYTFTIKTIDNKIELWANNGSTDVLLVTAVDQNSNYFKFGRIGLGAVGVVTAKFSNLSITDIPYTDTFETGEKIGFFGRGWSSNIDERISEMFGNTVAAHYESGGGIDTHRAENGDYKPPAWGHDKLVKNADGTFLLTKKNGAKLSFDNATGNGKLLSVSDSNGNMVKYTYSGNVPTAITEMLKQNTGAYTQGRLLNITASNGLITKITDPLGRSVKYYYDTDKNLASVVDFMGSTKTYTYSSKDNAMTCFTDYEGNIITTNTYGMNGKVSSQFFGYDGSNPIDFSYDKDFTSITVPDKIIQMNPSRRIPGGTWTYWFNDTNNIRQIAYPDGSVNTFTWDEAGNRTGFTDGNGNLTKYTYDEKGNILTITTKDSRDQVVSYAYEPIFNKVRLITDALGYKTTTQYDDKGNAIAIRDPQGNTTQMTYDQRGNMLTMTDALGRTTSRTYDSYGNLKSIVNPLNGVTNFNYDLVGRLNYETYVNGSYTTYTYDDNNNVLSVSKPLNSQVINTFDRNNRIKTTKDARGNTTTFGYDCAGNVDQSIDALGNAVNRVFDMSKYLLNGRSSKIFESAPYDRQTSYYYNAMDRLVLMIDPLGNSTTNQYDNAGNWTQTMDAENHTLYNTYDNLNRLVAFRDAFENQSWCSYDANNNKSTVTDANNHMSMYFYDELNRVVYTIDPRGNVTQFAYDSVGNMVRKTTPNGGVINYTYDALNRLTQVSYPNSTSITYTYDGMGNRTTMTDSLGQTTYTYDVLNRLTRTVAPGNIAVSYTYDANGNRAGMGTPLSVTTYGYDALNRSTGIVDGSYVTKYAYDAAGRRSQVTYPSGARAVYAYDNGDRLINLQNLKSNGTAISSFTYAYDKVGNKLTQLDKNGVTNYSYDAVYRLTGVQYPAVAGSSAAVVSFAYDNNGNRTRMIYNTTTTTYTYDACDRLVGESDNITYMYDNNGNLTKQLQNGATTCSYYYDSENRLAQVNYSTYVAVQYAYNGDGQRIYKQTPSKLWRYYYDLTELFGAMSGNTIERYVNGPNTGEMNYCIRTENGTSDGWIFHKDGMGSIVNLTDASQNITGSYVYDAFGTVRSQTGAKPNRFLYCGKEYEPEIGLYNSRARMYNSKWGRFINQDPAESGSNLYIYANSNPMNYIDPTGLSNDRLYDSSQSYRDYCDRIGREIYYEVREENEMYIRLLTEYNMSHMTLTNGPGSESSRLHVIEVSMEGKKALGNIENVEQSQSYPREYPTPLIEDQSDVIYDYNVPFPIPFGAVLFHLGYNLHLKSRSIEKEQVEDLLHSAQGASGSGMSLPYEPITLIDKWHPKSKWTRILKQIIQ